MLTNILIAAAAVAQAYGTPPAARPSPAPAAPVATPAPATITAPAAIPGRTLKDVPGTTISYYDIAGTTMPTITTSLNTMLANPAAADSVRLLTWDVGTQISNATSGTTCTVQSAKSTLTAKVRLPRLVNQANVKQDALAKWTAYVAGVENKAAADLWFVSDRLRGAEQSLVGLPCDQANAAWSAKVETVKSELAANIALRAQAAQPAAPAQPAQPAPKPAG